MDTVSNVDRFTDTATAYSYRPTSPNRIYVSRWCFSVVFSINMKTNCSKMIALKELVLGVVLLVSISTTKGGPCEEVEIVTRAEWDARPPLEVDFINTTVNMSFVHHTAGTWECFDKETCILMVQDIQNLHMDTNGWSDIGYSFLIGEDGRVYEGRGWNVVGAHTYMYNSVSYGFCVIGNFMTRPPNELALNTTQKIIDCGVQLGFTLRNYELFGHKDGRCTECPGDYLYAIIRTWSHYSFRTIPGRCTNSRGNSAVASWLSALFVLFVTLSFL